MEANGSIYSRLLKGKKLVMILLSVGVLSIITGFSVYETTKTELTLSLDGEEIEVKSHETTVKDVLEQENVDINEKHDYVQPGLDTEVKNGMKIIWKPAKQVTLNIDGEQEKIWTTESTVEELLSKQRIIVDEYSEIKPALTEKIKDNMNIIVKNALEISLVVGGEEEKVMTTSKTVAELLEEQEIELNKLDRVEPSEDEQLTNETVVNVIRVEKKTDVVEEEIDYKTTTKKDNSLEKGKEKVIQAGEKGKLKKEFEVTLENGKEVKRTLQKEEKIKDSKDRIVAVGTKQVVKNVSRSKPAPSGGKTIFMKSTAYTADCSGCSGVTATGINLKKNPNTKVIAVDPNVIPLGTKVHVDGYGYAIAGDTGGAIRGNKIDVFFSSKSKAYAWGSKTVKVKILN
ncbi:ubiquitin-like domain-containing protein [Pueribacillus sp. YX66]|uniref:ubiquitin-like domain-containing protein n=1 Tax=Pueribacillus sp. YX66 TaxID=3229242 RepID=UPI00358CE60E